MRNSVLETDGQTDSGTSAGVELRFTAKKHYLGQMDPKSAAPFLIGLEPKSRNLIG